MKTITSFLVKFAIVAVILTLAFRYFLSYGIDHGETVIIISSAVLYGLSMFFAGLHFGIKEGNYLPIYDVGFRFHLTTYFIFNVVSELWFVAKLNSVYEKVNVIHTTAFFWGIFLLLHFILYVQTRKHTIDSLDKTDLFE